MSTISTTPPEVTPDALAGPPAAFIDGPGVARLFSFSLSHLHELKAAGRFGPREIRFGRSVRYSVAECVGWANAGAPSRQRWQSMKGGAR